MGPLQCFVYTFTLTRSSFSEENEKGVVSRRGRNEVSHENRDAKPTDGVHMNVVEEKEKSREVERPRS